MCGGGHSHWERETIKVSLSWGCCHYLFILNIQDDGKTHSSVLANTQSKKFQKENTNYIILFWCRLNTSSHLYEPLYVFLNHPSCNQLLVSRFPLTHPCNSCDLTSNGAHRNENGSLQRSVTQGASAFCGSLPLSLTTCNWERSPSTSPKTWPWRDPPCLTGLYAADLLLSLANMEQSTSSIDSTRTCAKHWLSWLTLQAQQCWAAYIEIHIYMYINGDG